MKYSFGASFLSITPASRKRSSDRCHAPSLNTPSAGLKRCGGSLWRDHRGDIRKTRFSPLWLPIPAICPLSLIPKASDGIQPVLGSIKSTRR